MNLTIQLNTNGYTDDRCLICDGGIDGHDIQAVASDDTGRIRGAICPDCLASPNTLIARARLHARELRRAADALERVTVGTMVSIAAFNAARNASDAALEAKYGTGYFCDLFLTGGDPQLPIPPRAAALVDIRPEKELPF